MDSLRLFGFDLLDAPVDPGLTPFGTGDLRRDLTATETPLLVSRVPISSSPTDSH